MSWLIRLSMQSVGLKVIRFALGIGTSILLTHLMTQHDYGIYAYVLVVATLLAIPGEAGIPNLVMREITRARVDDDAPRIRGLMVFSNLTVLSLTLAMAAATGLFLWFAHGRVTYEFGVALALVLPAILLGALANTRSAIQRALGDPILSQIPEQVLRPVCIGVFGILFYVLTNGTLSAVEGVMGYALASACAFALGTILLRRTYRHTIGSGPAAFRTREWAYALLPFSAIAGLQVAMIQIAAFVLGFYAPPTELALFRVATLGADFALFSTLAITAITSPKFGEYYYRHDRKAMQELIGQTNFLNLMFSGAVLLAILITGPLALRLGFGRHYAASWAPMAILATGHLLGATMGNSITLANMSGHERLTIISTIFGFALNIVLSVILCSKFGAVGAALAAAITAVTWRGLVSILLYRASRIRAWDLELSLGRALLSYIPGVGAQRLLRRPPAEATEADLPGPATRDPGVRQKIGYIHDSKMPATEANTVNVAKMCDAIADNDYQCLLIHTGSGSGAEIREYYGLEHKFGAIGLPQKLFLRTRVLAWAAALRFRFAGVKLVYGRKPQLLLPSAKLGMSVVFESHYSLTRQQPRNREAFEALLERKKLKRIVVISQALRDDFASQWPQCEPLLFVAHDGADAMPEERRNTVKPGVAFDRPVIGYAGHLYPGKGMEMIAALSKTRSDVDFMVLGGTPGDLAHWRNELQGQSNVHLLGMVPHREVPAYLASCSIVLAPYAKVVRGIDRDSDISRWMSPLKIFEYMAQGLPIIASDLPVLREVLEHGRTAWLCKPGDVAAWNLSISQLLADPQLRSRLGEAARLTLETRYTWRQRAHAILNI